MTALRVGIVGARFAADLHAVNYRPLVPARVELSAVCARTRADAERFAKEADPVKVQVLSKGSTPDTIAERTMVIRSTAYNLVALFVTIGAAMFLLGWWGRRFLPRRKS